MSLHCVGRQQKIENIVRANEMYIRNLLSASTTYYRDILVSH